jgi:hypothetical protein
MRQNRFRWLLALGCALMVATALAAASNVAPPPPAASGDTVTPTLTWWCVNVNDVWNVKATVVMGVGYLQPPADPPITDTCTSPFPVAVRAGTAFAPGGFIWYTNKTYPREIRAALQGMEYDFHSQSPAEDFFSKIDAIRFEVKTYPGGVLVGEYAFKPHHVLKLVRTRDFYGPITGYMSTGMNMTEDEFGRLPLFGLPAVLPAPSEPGVYRVYMYVTLSEWHNDGLTLEEGSMLPAGENLYLLTRFIVVP